MEKHLQPSMPTIFPQKEPHRPKLSARAIPFNLMVARPVGRQEMTDNPLAEEAMRKEWTALTTQKVWKLMIVREKSDVVSEARIHNMTVHFGRVRGICVEKKYELPADHPSRKFKGRVVFSRNQVKNQ